MTKADLVVHVRAQLLARPSLTDEERHHFATSHLTSWCRGYLKRNSGLRQRFAQHAKPARLIAEGNFENVDHFFDILEKYKHLPPEQVLAGDETGLHGDGALRSRVLVPVGMKRVKTPKSRTQTHIGVMHIGSAKGDTLPPVMVFEGAWTYNHHVDALPKDALIGMQENGHFIGLHMIQVLQHIVKHAVAARPLLFIVDGASSHIDWDAILYAQKELIDILCLPANMTHKLQVADVALFGPFKRYWRHHGGGDVLGTGSRAQQRSARPGGGCSQSKGVGRAEAVHGRGHDAVRWRGRRADPRKEAGEGGQSTGGDSEESRARGHESGQGRCSCSGQQRA